MNILNRKLIAVIGPNGSGKGTFQNFLVKAGLGYGFGMSSMLRAYSEAEPSVREEIEECCSSGRLVPDKIVIDAFGHGVGESSLNGDNLAVEGLFRTRPQFRGAHELLERRLNDDFDSIFVFLTGGDEFCQERRKINGRL